MYDDPKKNLDTYTRKFTLQGLEYNVVSIYACEWDNRTVKENVPRVCTEKRYGERYNVWRIIRFYKMQYSCARAFG